MTKTNFSVGANLVFALSGLRGGVEIGPRLDLRPRLPWKKNPFSPRRERVGVRGELFLVAQASACAPSVELKQERYSSRVLY